MTVLEVLSEVVGAIELLALVALAELVDVCQMLSSCQPVRLRKVRKLFATVAADISLCDCAGRVGRLTVAAGIGRGCGARVEGGLEVALERCARP